MGVSPDLTTTRKDTATMAGYRKQARVYVLRFEDEEFAGLEVRARSVPVGTFLELTSLAGAAGREQVEHVGRLFAGFASALVSWNLEEDDGTAVPATLDGLRAQEFEFVLAIITAWMNAISGVAAPLGTTSSGGETIQEASLPVVPLSLSQAS